MCLTNWHKKMPEKSFLSVAMAFILVGIGIFAYGGVEWLVNQMSATTCFFFPGSKVAAGLVVMVLGYIMLELELMRQKK